MLDIMRRNSRNVVIYILFGIIIAVFVINFGPGSKGCSPRPQTSYAAKVGGKTLSEQDFRFAYIALGGAQFPGQVARERHLKEFVMDKLIERELLAQEADRLGFSVSQKEVEDMIADGRMVVLGVPRRVDSYVYKDGKFDYDRFKMVCQNQLGVSVMRFIEIEQRELLADKVRELTRAATKVSPEEVKADYEQKGNQVNLAYVRFSPRRFEDASEIPPSEIDAYLKTHQSELKKAYDERSFLYKKLDRQVRARHVLVELAKDAPADKVAQAQKQIDQAAAKIKAGTPLAAVAKTVSTDDATKARGGDTGWRKKGFTGFGDALDAKVFAAKKGELVGPMRTDRGFELVEVVGFREGDVPVDQAQRELAEEQIHDQHAKGKAKAEAEALLAKVKKGAKLAAIVPSSASKSDDDKGLREPGPKAEAPKLAETGLFSRHGEMVQDIGVSKELAARAFSLKVGEVAGPFEVAGAYVIVEVKEHKDPDAADFEKRKAELMRESARTKWAEVLDSWSKQRCAEVRDDGRIQVNDEIIAYEGLPAAKGAAVGTKYTPCGASKLF